MAGGGGRSVDLGPLAGVFSGNRLGSSVDAGKVQLYTNLQ